MPEGSSNALSTAHARLLPTNDQTLPQMYITIPRNSSNNQMSYQIYVNSNSAQGKLRLKSRSLWHSKF